MLLLVAGVGLAAYAQERTAECRYVPLLAENLLPNADLAQTDQGSPLPQGWAAGAPGVQVGEFAVDGDGRALQLLGIANYIQTPQLAVQPGRTYCFTGLAITDSHQGSTARLQVAFHWLDAQGQLLHSDTAPWQEAVLWQPDAIPDSWATIMAAFRAPPDAAALRVRLHPSSDDRIYVDAMQVRQGGIALPRSDPPADLPLTIMPWPENQRAALSFSFDWDTAMGGLIHSRSVADPNCDQDPVARGLRMREGITTTLDIFRPHNIRATYYATGYNFLSGNTEQREFMGNPVYAWANTENRWLSDQWTETPWFAPDPYGTVQSHPAWYFGDLVPLLQAEDQDIQSHTFSHFYGGFVGPDDWRADIAVWHTVAEAQRVPSFRSLAFPWSSSGGMSEANWRVLAEEGVTSVTRLSDQAPYNLFPADERGLVREPRCRPLPGHAQIIACPDFYLTPEREQLAQQQIDRALQQGGTIDIWAHTEEVVTPEQRAAWQDVVDYAVAQDDLWIAPLREIADWQHALDEVEVERISQNAAPDEPVEFRVTNPPPGLTLRLPFVPERVQLLDAANQDSPDTVAPVYILDGDILIIQNVAGGYEVTIQAWLGT